MKDSICTVLVNTCDAYEDAWEPFFKLLKKYWPDREYPIVLNTETKKFDYEDLNIKTINVKNYNPKTSWSSRLINVLNQIDSEYILFFLEDFFITDYVDNSKLNEVIEWMQNDSSIGVFSFNTVEKNKYCDVISDKYIGYQLRNKKGPYRFNCQIAVWRKDVLKKSLRKYENAWEWELIGNRRSRFLKEKFYTLTLKRDMIFKYDCENVGIVRGKWRLPGVKELFNKEEIEIDLSIRNNVKTQDRKENRLFSKFRLYLKKIRALI